MSLAAPAWLVALLLVPLLLVAAILAMRQRSRRWRRFVAPRLSQFLVRAASPLPRWIALLSLLAGFAALVGALARPQGQAGTRTETVRGRNVLFAIDLSRSMRTQDVLPDRLSHAKALAYEMLDALPDDRVGVIGFAGSSFRFAPLTIDHAAVRDTIEQLDIDSVQSRGSDLAGAVRCAIEAFGPNSRGRNALVLLSDGEEHTGEIDGTAVAAARAGLRIIAIGIGTTEGAIIPDPNADDGKYRDREGNPVLSRLNPKPLRAFAEETNGQFVIANSATNLADLVRGMCQGLDSFEIGNRQRTVHVEFFQWLVLPAILLLAVSVIAATRWRKTVGNAAALPMLLLMPLATDARAAWPPADATAPGGERSARLRLGEGTDAYRRDNLREARGKLSEALLARDPAVQAAAHHNLGVTLLESGWRQLSGGQPYPSDPAKAPEMLEEFVAAKTAEWLAAKEPADSPSPAFHAFESVILSWTDAVRHFDSAVRADPARDDSRHNRELAAELLNRLRDQLQKQADQTESQLPEQQPQQQQSPGDQQQKDPSDGQQGDPNAPQKPNPDQDRKDGKQPEQPPEQPPNHGGNDQQEPPQTEQGKADRKQQPDRADETPAQRARRLLGENADLEKGPLIRNRRHELFQPDKDW